jgi:hypothetical protein
MTARAEVRGPFINLPNEMIYDGIGQIVATRGYGFKQ